MLGGVTRHMLPHLPGVPHLHVNRPLMHNNKPKVSPAILNFYYLVFIVLITPKDFLRKMSSSSCDDKSKMTDVRIASECFIKSTVIMQEAPNENAVQNHLNIALLNVFYYLNCRYSYISFYPLKIFHLFGFPS